MMTTTKRQQRPRRPSSKLPPRRCPRDASTNPFVPCQELRLQAMERDLFEKQCERRAVQKKKNKEKNPPPILTVDSPHGQRVCNSKSRCVLCPQWLEMHCQTDLSAAIHLGMKSVEPRVRNRARVTSGRLFFLSLILLSYLHLLQMVSPWLSCSPTREVESQTASSDR